MPNDGVPTCDEQFGALRCVFTSIPQNVTTPSALNRGERAIGLDLRLTLPSYYLGSVYFRYTGQLGSCPPFASGRVLYFNGTDQNNASAATEIPAASVQPSNLRSIFGTRNALFSSCTDPVTFSVLTYILFLVVALVVIAILRRRAKSRDEGYTSWFDIPQWRSLLLQHMWVQLFFPCHPMCALTHLLTFANHVLIIIVVTSGASLFFVGELDTVYAVFAIVVFSLLLSQPIRIPLAAYFWAWKTDEDAVVKYKREMEESKSSTMKSKTKSFSNTFSNTYQSEQFKNDGLLALDNIVLEESASTSKVPPTYGKTSAALMVDAALDFDLQIDWRTEDIVVDYSEGVAGKQTAFESNFSSDNDTSEAMATPLRDEDLRNFEFVQEEATNDLAPNATLGALGLEADGIADDDIEVVSLSSSESPAPRKKKSCKSSSARSSTIGGGDAASERELEVAMFPIIVDEYVRKGVVIHALCSTLLVILAYVFGGMLGASHTVCTQFKTALLYTLIADCLVMQPFFVLLTLGYRWLTFDDTADTLYSELHPCHGEVKEC